MPVSFSGKTRVQNAVYVIRHDYGSDDIVAMTVAVQQAVEDDPTGLG